MTPELTENALKALEARYLLRDDRGQVCESAEDMFWRVARAVAVVEERLGNRVTAAEAAERFFDLMASLAFLPNSPTLMNAGTELGQLSACFVLPVGDSLLEIFNTLRDAALIHQSGGGTGFSFSRLRPAGDWVRSTMGISSGPVSFMRAYDAATEAIKQGGTRRGANMGILRVDHPDILEFVHAKDRQGVLTNFNISVAVSQAFMRALWLGEDYPLINPRTGAQTGRLSAPRVFEEICTQAWKNGEPGLIFIDRVNARHPLVHLGSIEATNPCGEQPLLPYEACTLGSINLMKFARSDGSLDYARLLEAIHWAVRFLDDVVEVSRYPLDAIEQLSHKNRKIGLGVMGFADLLILQGVPYGSPQALTVADELMAFIHQESLAASHKLALERGAYANQPSDQGWPLRNSTVNTIAPTGTLSLIAGVSSGIEPVFSFEYERHVLGTVLKEVHPLYQGRLCAGAAVDPAVFVTAHQIPAQSHVRMQAAFQKHVDNAVSKTINFPEKARVEDVQEAFRLADELECKGITVYRDGSRRSQVLNVCDSCKAK